MPNRKFVSTMGLSLAFFAFAAEVQAAPPAECSSGRQLSSYNLGRTLGGNIVSMAWARSGEDPDGIDAFTDTVQGSIVTEIGKLPAQSSQMVLCRAQGLLDGAVTKLGDIQETVATECFFDGGFWGEFSAGVYCALAEAFDGLPASGIYLPRAEVGLCGAAFEVGCEISFVTVATDSLTCEPYTVEEHDEAFYETLHNQCTYEVEA